MGKGDETGQGRPPINMRYWAAARERKPTGGLSLAAFKMEDAPAVPLAQFPTPPSESVDAYADRGLRIEGAAKNLVRRHPLGIPGGFIDNAISLTDSAERELLVECASQRLLVQTVPGLAERLELDADIAKQYSVNWEYLMRVITDRKEWGFSSEPRDVADIDSSGTLTIGGVLDLVEKMPFDEGTAYLQQYALSTALMNLGFESPSKNPSVFSHRMMDELTFLKEARDARRKFPSQKKKE